MVRHYRTLDTENVQFLIRQGHTEEGFVVQIEFWYNGQEYVIPIRCLNKKQREKLFNSIEEEDLMDYYHEATKTGKN